MTSVHRDIIAALTTAIQAGVADTSAWSFYVEEPVRHNPNGQHCAIWFEGDTVNDQHNSTGDIDVTDLYGIRYWEPAPLKSQKYVDEDAAVGIEDLMDQVRTIIQKNQVGLGTSYSTMYRGSRKFIGQDSTPSGTQVNDQVAGFEIAVTARRRIGRT